jgi:hypothetical protein
MLCIWLGMKLIIAYSTDKFTICFPSHPHFDITVRICLCLIITVSKNPIKFTYNSDQWRLDLWYIPCIVIIDLYYTMLVRPTLVVSVTVSISCEHVHVVSVYITCMHDTPRVRAESVSVQYCHVGMCVQLFHAPVNSWTGNREEYSTYCPIFVDLCVWLVFWRKLAEAVLYCTQYSDGKSIISRHDRHVCGYICQQGPCTVAIFDLVYLHNIIGNRSTVGLCFTHQKWKYQWCYDVVR